MARSSASADAARCQRPLHCGKRAQILPRKPQTEAADALSPLFVVRGEDAPALPAPASLGEVPDRAAVPPVGRAATDRASVARAASCPFAAQSGPVRVASLPRTQSAGWRREVPGAAGVVRSVGA